MTLLQRLKDVEYPRKVINDLEFADDIPLFENSLEEAQVQLNRTPAETQKIGLVIKTKKTEFMTSTSCKKNLTLNNEDIKLANDFTYLGSKMTFTESDVKRRLSLAWSAFWKLKRLWPSKITPIELKIKLFQATRLSIVT